MDKSVAVKVKKFFSDFEFQKIPKGTIIVSPKENERHVYLLNNGIVRIYSINKNGEETTLLLLKSYSFFPTTPLFLNKANNYYFQAITASGIYKAPRQRVLTFIKDNPDILLDLTIRILRGIEGMFAQIEYLYNGNAYQKLINMLLVSSTRFTCSVDDTISLPFTHQLIATIIGCKRETVSRELKKLKQKKIITTYPSIITILNRKLLENELGNI